MNLEQIKHEIDKYSDKLFDEAKEYIDDVDFENLMKLSDMRYAKLFISSNFQTDIRNRLYLMGTLKHAFYDDGEFTLIYYKCVHNHIINHDINSISYFVIQNNIADIDDLDIINLVENDNRTIKHILSLEIWTKRFEPEDLNFISDLDYPISLTHSSGRDDAIEYFKLESDNKTRVFDRVSRDCYYQKII